MFTFRTPKFQSWREIDIEVTGNTANTVTTNVINGDQAFEWSADIADDDSAVISGNTRTDFHDYAFEWLPDSITWYVDGEVIRTYGTSEKRPIPDLSAKIMMNLWIFNGTAAFGGPEIENNQYPMTAEYEWFRFYKWDGDTYPCEAMNETCMTAADIASGLASNNPCDGIPGGASYQTLNGDTKTACSAACN